MKDLMTEEHQHPIKWAKTAGKGAFMGSIFGYLAFLGGNSGPFEMGKLDAAAGYRNWSGRGIR